ncbi:hypothetical protein CPT06_03860 [Bacillus vallismortis]|nr:hypothetical protein CPT06_03860 [Bacillus vallismortis]
MLSDESRHVIIRTLDSNGKELAADMHAALLKTQHHPHVRRSEWTLEKLVGEIGFLNAYVFHCGNAVGTINQNTQHFF